MPEGHTIHRAARDHHRIFAGKQITISSPQGRFADGAALLSGRQCLCVEAFGKHLIYHFDHSDVLHIHLGLFGRIRKHKLPQAEPKGAVRVRLVGDTHVIDINGPTICQILPRQEFLRLIDRIGPDVLRSDANPDLVFNRISKSRAPIGRLIMDQSVMAGIGNIYRSEILWRQSIHPETPGSAISRDMFDRIWNDAKILLALGVKHNTIITTNATSRAKSRYRERVNIFAKTICPTCKGAIRRFEINGRRAFLCETCQPLPG